MATLKSGLPSSETVRWCGWRALMFVECLFGTSIHSRYGRALKPASTARSCALWSPCSAGRRCLAAHMQDVAPDIASVVDLDMSQACHGDSLDADEAAATPGRGLAATRCHQAADSTAGRLLVGRGCAEQGRQPAPAVLRSARAAGSAFFMPSHAGAFELSTSRRASMIAGLLTLRSSWRPTPHPSTSDALRLRARGVDAHSDQFGFGPIIGEI